MGSESLAFTLTSTDNGPFGMNTPAYFAVDNHVSLAVPEPSSVVLFVIGVGSAGLWSLRRRMHLR
jgi:Domain of unknown function (DUF4465)/PEP-CTERM motif